ncbi:MAG: phospholipase D-like domain-containing protein [bacterium]
MKKILTSTPQTKKTLFILLTISLFFITTVIFASVTNVKPIHNKDYFQKVHSLLLQAKKSIYMIMFEIRYYHKYPNSPANRLVRDLMQAAKRGVDVEVILEQAKEFNEKNSKANKEVGVMLTSAGIKVYLDSPYQTTHNKLILVDGIYTVVGSTNWTYHGLKKNNESSVLIESKEITNTFTKYFIRIKRTCKPLFIPNKK